MTDQDQSDLAVFGPQQWVFCDLHKAVGLTGTCLCAARWKLGMGVFSPPNDDTSSTGASASQAREKARSMGLLDLQPVAGDRLRFSVSIERRAWEKYIKRAARAGLTGAASEVLEGALACLLSQEVPPAEAAKSSTSLMMVLGRVRVTEEG